MYNGHMNQRKKVLVVGGGPAGIQAALAAARGGCGVTLVSEGLPGGRAAWQTLLPSKMWLEASAPADGTLVSSLRERYERVAATWQKKILEELESTGVELALGMASFLSAHEVSILGPEGGYSDQRSADAIILATGAVPFLPPGIQIDGERILSPHLVNKIEYLPQRMIVIGAGGPATEYVDAFSRLGVQITWVTGPVGVLSAFPPDAGRLIAARMQRRGVQIITGLMARSVERTADGVRVLTADGQLHHAEMAFVAIGLRPDLDRLNLPAAGLRSGSSGGLATDPFFRTNVPHIYLVGDAASPLSANISMAQGRLAGCHAAGLPVEPLQMENAVMAIYTDPQVAVVGRMTDHAQVLQRIRVPFLSSLGAHLIDDPEGYRDCFLEIAYDPQRRLTGALGVCPGAAEILTTLAVAVQAHLSLDVFATVYPAHPTISELAVIAAQQAH